jgi:transposase
MYENGNTKPCLEELLIKHISILEQRIKQIETILDEKDKIIAIQSEHITNLENELAKYKKNSSNSSKPPSSDIVKPPAKKNDKTARKIGGQPGHERHERTPLTPEDIDEIVNHYLDKCPDCNGSLIAAGMAPRVLQQIEIIEKPVEVREHHGQAYFCERCGKYHYAPLPPEIEKAGLAGPLLTALIGYMKGCCHASYSTIAAFLEDFAHIKVSRGFLVKVVMKAAAAIEQPYNELLNLIPMEPAVNIDETGHKLNKERYWTWCFRANLYVLFKIDKSRGSKVLIEVLGEEFDGVIGCDYFSAYRKYMKNFDIYVQFCIAHLIRDIKFLVSLYDKPAALYGKRLLEEIRNLFKIIHSQDEMTPDSFQQALEDQKKIIITTATTNIPNHKATRNMANRFINFGDAYFKFITTPGIGPTNNIAEQAIRFVVIDRHITHGTRSESGNHWCERIWSVMATCSVQNLSPFQFLLSAVKAFFSGTQAPSLLSNHL